MNDYNAAIIDEFRANAGKVGGRWEGRDLLLMTTKGRKSAPEGKRAVGRLRTLSRRIEDEFFEPLDAQQRKQLHALLLRLAEYHLPHCGAMARK